MRIPILFLPTLLVAAVLTACSRSEAPAEPVRAVRTMTIGTGSATASNEYAAEVRARTESRLGFRVGGKLVRRPVELGEVVKPGQLLAQLDGADLQLAQDAAQAALRAAQANLDQAAVDLKRARELQAQQFVGVAEVDRRETALKAAQATLEQARAQASAQGNQAAYTRLLADAAGVITSVDAEPGAVLAAGAPVLRLAHDGPRDVVFSVPEDRLPALRALRGKAGALQVQLWGSDAATATPIAATVREVAAAADASTRTFLVKADVGRADVRLGQTATVRVPGAAREGVVRLPLAAVLEQGGRSVVWVLDPQAMTVDTRAVQIAGADARQVVVSAGLAAGAEVVTAGAHALTQGQKVRRYVEPKAAAPVAMPASLAASR
jgi:RND family efflux transporter MFP subunit